MALNVMGMFDTARDAQAAARELHAAGFRDGDISLIGNNTRGDYDPEDSGETSGSHAWTGVATADFLVGLVNMGAPEDDAHVYSEGVRRGGSLLSVLVDDEQAADRAAEIMNRNNIVDIDQRGAQYRQAGWSRFDPDAAPSDLAVDAPDGATMHTMVTETMPVSTQSGIETTLLTTGARPANPQQGDTVRVPVVEEELQIGKRAVERGGVRVYQRIVETLVNQQVTLRDETVRVERRPVDRPVAEADFAQIRQGTVEIREHHEQAVVQKQARIVEEVRITKEVEQRVATVQDTVRRTDVDVEEIAATPQNTSGVEVLRPAPTAVTANNASSTSPRTTRQSSKRGSKKRSRSR
jgi:uncharacterized protein (TIGR02271 family)